jgi:hypothetical protein
MISDARKDPSNAAHVLETLRTFQREQAVQLRDLFTQEAYEKIGRRSQAIELQLSALASDPNGLLKILEQGLTMTPEQKKKIQPLVDRLSDRVKQLTADMAGVTGTKDRMTRIMDGTDQLVSLAMEDRLRIRDALTPEQREKFDTEFHYGSRPPGKAKGESSAQEK